MTTGGNDGKETAFYSGCIWFWKIRAFIYEINTKIFRTSGEKLHSRSAGTVYHGNPEESRADASVRCSCKH